MFVNAKDGANQGLVSALRNMLVRHDVQAVGEINVYRGFVDLIIFDGHESSGVTAFPYVNPIKVYREIKEFLVPPAELKVVVHAMLGGHEGVAEELRNLAKVNKAKYSASVFVYMNTIQVYYMDEIEKSVQFTLSVDEVASFLFGTVRDIVVKPGADPLLVKLARTIVKNSKIQVSVEIHKDHVRVNAHTCGYQPGKFGDALDMLCEFVFPRDKSRDSEVLVKKSYGGRKFLYNDIVRLVKDLNLPYKGTIHVTDTVIYSSLKHFDGGYTNLHIKIDQTHLHKAYIQVKEELEKLT